MFVLFTIRIYYLKCINCLCFLIETLYVSVYIYLFTVKNVTKTLKRYTQRQLIAQALNLPLYTYKINTKSTHYLIHFQVP